MAECRAAPPPLFQLDGARVASCSLYREEGEARTTQQLNEVIHA
jgi:hypothetical protein